MELRQLKYFLKAKELKSFTAAAKQLNISQSTLSQQIKQLEEEIGLPLFHRLGKRITPTEASDIFSKYAQNSVQRAKEGLLAMQDLQQLQRGTLRIGVSYGLRPTLITAIKSFTQKYPQIKIEITFGMTSTIINRLKDSKLDVVLCFEEDHSDTQLDYTPLFVSEMALVCGSRSKIAQYPSISFKKIKKLPLALLPPGYSTSSFIRAQLRDSGWKGELMLEINDTPTLLEMTRTGNWYTILTKSTAEKEKGVRCISIEEKDVKRTASLVFQQDIYISAVMNAFRKELMPK